MSLPTRPTTRTAPTLPACIGQPDTAAISATPVATPAATTPRPMRSALGAALATAVLVLAGCASTPPADGPAQADVAPPAARTSPAPQPAAAPALPAAPTAAATPAPAAVATPSPVANPAPIALDPLDPTDPLVLGSASARSDLWGRVRQGRAIPDLDNERVQKWEQWYSSRPDYVQRMTERGGRYLFHIVEEVNKRGLPMELALLPFIESAFNPQAMSSARASGMWQFIPGTGRDFDLRQNLFRDDRRDVLASTRAALDYLQMLHGMFGDWQLALAAYNWGQGNVQRAVARNQKAGLPTDYDSLRMPDETRNYLPKLQAVENIVANPQAFGLALPPLQNHPYFVVVAIERDIDVDLAARLAGLPLDEFKALNPQMNKPVILAAGTPQVLLPYDNANQFVRAITTHRGSLASWTAWVAPRDISVAEAARSVGMDEARLREVNAIPRGMRVKKDSVLLVHRSAHRQEDVAEHIADHAMLALAPEVVLKRLAFKAGRKGDSVAAVAQRYRVKPEQVASWNGTSASARFKPGQTVVVMVAMRPAKAGVRKPATRVAEPKSAARVAAQPAGRKAAPAARSAAGARPLGKPPATARTRRPAD